MELRPIDKGQHIETETRNKNQHFMSLLNAGYDTGILKEQTVVTIQAGIASLLCRQIRRYTFDESSSVKEETAFAILGSVYYTIDAYASALNDSNDLFTVFGDKSIDEIYKAGQKIVKSCFAETQKLYREIAGGKLDLPLVTYNDTIDHALPAFFKTYDMEFHAQDTTCSMDYPVVFDDMTIQGIFYIRQYLEKLRLETWFCHCFTQENILQVLRDYAVKFQLDIANTPVNLFEILFDQLIFSLLSGNNTMEFTLPAPQLKNMLDELEGKSDTEICSLIDQAVEDMIAGLSLGEPELIDYIKRYQVQFATRFLNAHGQRTLPNMVLVTGDNPDAGKHIFVDGERMSDEKFAHLIELLQCETLSEKLKLISAEVHSIKDYIDLLDSNCLYDEEHIAVLGALGDIELAVLGSRVFREDLRSGPVHLLPKVLDSYRNKTQREWKILYIDFLCKASEEKRTDIETLINSMFCDSAAAIE